MQLMLKDLTGLPQLAKPVLGAMSCLFLDFHADPIHDTMEETQPPTLAIQACAEDNQIYEQSSCHRPSVCLVLQVNTFRD